MLNSGEALLVMFFRDLCIIEMMTLFILTLFRTFFRIFLRKLQRYHQQREKSTERILKRFFKRLPTMVGQSENFEFKNV